MFLAQDEEDWHRADSDKYEAEGEGELYEFGQECLDRLSLSLGGKTIVPLASSLLPQLLSSQDWKQRHAALICLAQIAEGCAKVMQTNMSGLVDMCMRVRIPPLPGWSCQTIRRECSKSIPQLWTILHCLFQSYEKSGKQSLQHWCVRSVLVRRTSVHAGGVIAAQSLPSSQGHAAADADVACCGRRACKTSMPRCAGRPARRWARCARIWGLSSKTRSTSAFCRG